MASISIEPSGRRRIQFAAPDGRRKTLRLGKVNLKLAEVVKLRVEALVAALIVGASPDDETSRWVASLDDTMHAKLAAAGLVKGRQTKGATTLKAFIDGYIAGRTDVKPNTLIGLGQARRNLLAFFGDTRDIRTINAGDAEEYWRHLAGKLAVNTVRRLCGRAKQFFRFAVRKRLIAENPFADLETNVRGSAPERKFFIDRPTADKILDACPDAQWRLLFALSRYGGLRCPSEHLALKWSDVKWDTGRLRVPSPKTEHIEGQDHRVIPMFPELRGPLLEVFEQAEPGVEHVITRYRQLNANLRTQLQRIIQRAGVEPWPKLFHNLRASRQTELAERYPLHVVCGWLGNSPPVARSHYLSITDEHYTRATGGNEKATQNPTQRTATLSHAESKMEGTNPRFCLEKPLGVTPRDCTGNVIVASIGVEPIRP